MLSWNTIRQWLGILLKDTLRYRRALSGGHAPNGDPMWTRLCNRIEHLEPNPNGPGVRCDWTWGSDLHACHFVPAWGRRLLERAFDRWPIRFADSPAATSQPVVSFLFAHRGQERLPQLCQVLQSVFGQQDMPVECVVVDLTPEPLLAMLPGGVVYQHVDTSRLEPGWYKAWAFNLAARRACGEILVFQDGDVCVPAGYAAELVRTFRDEGCDAASIQRFLFYLDESSSQRLMSENRVPRGVTPVRVLQNWKGGTIAVRRGAFFDLGGFDEGFVDWGGEDDEFYDRCGALQHCRFGYLPFVHLWHVPQANRRAPDNLNITDVLPARLAVARQRRIEELVARGCGVLDGPIPRERYKAKIER